MGKKGSINRTEEVRKYMRANPTKSNVEIRRDLEDQGTKVSESLVSQVRKEPEMPPLVGPNKKTTTKQAAKKTPKKKAGKKKTAAKKKTPTTTQVAPAPAAGSQVITAEDLFDAKKLADELGGIDRVREALDALERLR